MNKKKKFKSVDELQLFNLNGHVGAVLKFSYDEIEFAISSNHGDACIKLSANNAVFQR